ncbi:MAG: hypothetical protein QOJ81_1327 [Chloroflexota bacterium]|jgi:hypothetical protein|nr:hypothetical protein [Chloroflexota bacterium]
MTRDEGFAIADTSTSHHDDAKVKAMWRVLAPDSDAMNKAMVMHEAVRLASWRDGKRLTAVDACPVWVKDPGAAVAHLQAAGLLDEEARIPRSTWSQWFGAAKRRREKSRADWRRRKEEQRSRTKVTPESNGGHAGHPQDSRTPSVRPSVPTVRPSPRASAGRTTGQMTRIGEVIGGEHDESVAAGLALLREADRR